MGFIESMNERVKRLDILDVKLVQGAAICFALVIVKFVPQIMNISVWWFAVLAVACAVRPMRVFWARLPLSRAAR